MFKYVNMNFNIDYRLSYIKMKKNSFFKRESN